MSKKVKARFAIVGLMIILVPYTMVRFALYPFLWLFDIVPPLYDIEKFPKLKKYL